MLLGDGDTGKSMVALLFGALIHAGRSDIAELAGTKTRVAYADWETSAGYSTRDIAQELGISRGMARQHVTRVISFVKQRGRMEAGEEAALTKRQEDVADLLRRGLSDREIAAQLEVGIRTAESHVTSVLRKLRAASRTELAER